MCNYDYDPADFYSENERTAKKSHTCSECGRSIAVGEEYKNHFGIWEGRAETFKTCSHCLVAQNYIREKCGSFLHGGLEEDVEEHAYGKDAIKVYKMLIGIRRQWRKFKSDSLMTVSR